MQIGRYLFLQIQLPAMSTPSIRDGKALSKLLRHTVPRSIIQPGGWVDRPFIEQQLGLTWPYLTRLCHSDNKGRFELDIANERIRATQGHSLKGMDETGLFQSVMCTEGFAVHLTSASNLLAIIRCHRLSPMRRTHVHLHPIRSRQCLQALRATPRRTHVLVFPITALPALVSSSNGYLLHPAPISTDLCIMSGPLAHIKDRLAPMLPPSPPQLPAMSDADGTPCQQANAYLRATGSLSPEHSEDSEDASTMAEKLNELLEENESIKMATAQELASIILDGKLPSWKIVIQTHIDQLQAQFDNVAEAVTCAVPDRLVDPVGASITRACNTINNILVFAKSNCQ